MAISGEVTVVVDAEHACVLSPGKFDRDEHSTTERESICYRSDATSRITIGADQGLGIVDAKCNGILGAGEIDRRKNPAGIKKPGYLVCAITAVETDQVTRAIYTGEICPALVRIIDRREDAVRIGETVDHSKAVDVISYDLASVVDSISLSPCGSWIYDRRKHAIRV